MAKKAVNYGKVALSEFKPKVSSKKQTDMQR